MDKRVKIVWADGSFRVDLPDYEMIPGTFLPIIPDVIHQDGVFPTIDPADPRLRGMSVEVHIPSVLCDPDTGEFSLKCMRERHYKHLKWGNPDYSPDIDIERGG